MANIIANEKSLRHNNKVNVINKSVDNRVKTITKKNRNLKTQESLNAAYAEIDKACAKGVYTKNKANRLKAKAAKALKTA